ncbi:uncharacterized protein LOC132308490 isoform X2 [Cornus florida]|uniref:uncharacterized protein LOC132308490 isoform X2 n=1 Tax=Cornus florida TaxID=4283 RepID=UPI00289A6686|nr:uncharacterized protein LOC132308490 isoform X2 [Cornus florida]
MGGGGAMRAVAKVAGIGVVSGGFRGIPALSPAEHQVAAAACKASRPASAILSSSDDGKTNVLNAAVQKPCWDDWEFAGGEDELILESGEPMPRLVFGEVATLQEAKEATSELSDAVDKMYLSKSTVGEEPVRAGLGSSLSLLSNSEYLETKACVTSETTPPPTGALQAFRLLNENPLAQSVVASIASDPNVWQAVFQNPEFVSYIDLKKTALSRES